MNKTDTDNEAGPTTLISHLNDPSNEEITYNEDDDRNYIKSQEIVNQNISPLETNIINEFKEDNNNITGP